MVRAAVKPVSEVRKVNVAALVLDYFLDADLAGGGEIHHGTGVDGCQGRMKGESRCRVIAPAWNATKD